MKNNIPAFLLTCIIPFLTGCAAIKTADYQLEKCPHTVDFTDASKTLKIYFPSFTDSSWSEDNRYVIGGDGSVIVYPNGKIMVVDGFTSAASVQFADFIESLGITRIDYLILTHFHGDHSGSFPEIIERFNVDTVYTNGAPTDTAPTRRLLDAMEKHNVKEIILKEGDAFSVGDCQITVYSPNLTEKDIDTIFNNPGYTEKKINNSSIVFKLTYNGFSCLFSGDVYKGLDKKLCRKYGAELKSTVLKAPHHGEFYTANSIVFAETVQPEYVVVMDNRYVSTMGNIVSSRYAHNGGKLLFRDDAGLIFVESDGNQYSVSERSF